ncbi:hypothetical protein SCHPADRAFT_948174, partial [Schizopora paradoxa]
MAPPCTATALVLTELAAIKQLGHAGPWVYENWKEHFPTSVKANKYPTDGLLAFAKALDPTTVAGYEGLAEHGSSAPEMIIILLKDVLTTDEKQRGALLDGRGKFSHRSGHVSALRKYVGGLLRVDNFNIAFDQFLEDYEAKPWQFLMAQGTMYQWPLAAGEDRPLDFNVGVAATALKPYFSPIFLDTSQSDDEMGNLHNLYKDLLLKSMVTTAWNRLDKAGKKWLARRSQLCKEYEDVRHEIQDAKDSMTSVEIAKLAKLFSLKAQAYIKTLEMKIQKGDEERLAKVKASVEEFLELVKGLDTQVSGGVTNVDSDSLPTPCGSRLG